METFERGGFLGCRLRCFHQATEPNHHIFHDTRVQVIAAELTLPLFFDQLSLTQDIQMVRHRGFTHLTSLSDFSSRQGLHTQHLQDLPSGRIIESFKKRVHGFDNSTNVEIMQAETLKNQMLDLHPFATRTHHHQDGDGDQDHHQTHGDGGL